MKQHNQVLSKFGRASLVALFATGLAFTGVAPAGALEGEPVQPGTSPIPGISSVARVEIPRMAMYMENGASKNAPTVDVCTGVLLDEQHIATMKRCVTTADGKPYDFALSEKAGNETPPPPRVTFGSEAVPSGGFNNVFWISSVALDPKAATQVVIARLDRPVPAEVASPVAVKDSGINGNMSGQEAVMIGWRPEGGTPRLSYQSTKLPITKLVNNTVTLPRSKVQQWNQWRENHPSFKDDKDLGTISWDAVRKGWEDPQKITVISEDIGAPVLSKDGKTLVGIHIGLGIILDAQQTDFHYFLTTRPAAADEVVIPNPESESAPKDALDIIQEALCQKGENGEGKDSIDGQKVSIEYNEAADKNVEERIGVGIKKVINSNPEFKAAGGDIVKKSEYNFDGYVGGKATAGGATQRTPIYKVQSTMCKASIDKSISALMSDILKQQGYIDGKIKKLQEDEKAAKNAKNRYDDKVRELDELNQRIDEFNNPTTIADFQRTHNYAGLPTWVREGVSYQDPDSEKQFCNRDQRLADTTGGTCRPLVTMGTVFADPGVNDTKAGEKLHKWLKEAKRNVSFELDTARNDATEKSTELSEATKALSLAQMNKTVAEKVKGIATAAQAEADNIAAAIQAEWAEKVYNKNKAFLDDYYQWGNDAYSLRQEIAQAEKAKAQLEKELRESQVELEHAKNASPYDKTKEDTAQAKVAAARQNVDDKSKEIAEKKASLAKLKAPSPTDEKYQPQISNLSAKLADVAQKMPNLVLNVNNAKWTMRALVKSMDGSALEDPTEKDSIAEQIGGYYNRAVAARPDIMRRQIKIGDMLTDARNRLETAPEKVKPQLKILVSDLERHAGRADEAANTVGGAVDKLKDLWDKARRTNSVLDAKKYLLQAQTELGTVDDPIKTSEEALKDAVGTNDAIQALLSGKSFEDIVNEKNMTPEEKAKKAAEESKAREDALRKKLEEELKKKYGIGQDGKPGDTPEKRQQAEKEKLEAEKKQAEEEKKKADDEAKKDEARLAKALSKNTLRAEGTDRVLTSIAAWKIGKFPGDSLVLVDGNVHADGLSATPFAAALKAPVLLTCWNTGLEPALMDQIKASGKKKLFLVGGQVPMTPYDEFELRDAGLDIFRIAGPDRYATSVGVNQATEPLIGAKPKKPINLYIGDGVGFPDALVAGAAAGRVGGLMLLSKGKQLDPQTYNYISNLGQTRPLKIIPVGGSATAAVKNTPWPTTMSVNIAPIVGKDRYETAAKLATTLPGTRAAVLATGENFADALSGGPLAVDQNATLVLTRSQELPPASYQSLQRFGSEKTIVMGGKAAVSPKVAELINGATLKNTDTKTVLGTLLERKKLRDDKANQEAKERHNALSKVRGMIKDSNSLKDVMSQLGFGSIDDLTKLLNDFKAQQDKDKKPDTAKPELDKSSTTTGK